MASKARQLRREQVAHLVRAAAGITNEGTLVLLGTGAVIAQLKAPPPELTATRKVDLYAPGVSDPAAMSRLVNAAIGEGTPFDDLFGYFAHGAGQDAAILPHDWRLRARPVKLPGAPGITCICPDADDVALGKLCAWQENDRRWLEAAWRVRLLGADALRERAKAISDPRAPGLAEIGQRIGALEAGLSPSGNRPEGAPSDGQAARDAAGGRQG